MPDRSRRPTTRIENLPSPRPSGILCTSVIAAPSSETHRGRDGRTIMHILDIFQAHPDHLQLRVLPAEDRQGVGRAVRNIAQLQALQPVVRLGHLRRGRLDPRADPRPDRPHPARDQPDGRLAPDLRLPHARTSWRRSSTATPARASRTSWPSAATRPANLADYDRAQRRLPVRRASSSRFIQLADRTRPTRAASASASPASPRGTPARPTGSRRWTT